jgi:hypothetical protein
MAPVLPRPYLSIDCLGIMDLWDIISPPGVVQFVQSGARARPSDPPSCSIGLATLSDEASCPLDWRLFIPEEWDEDSDFTVR